MSTCLLILFHLLSSFVTVFLNLVLVKLEAMPKYSMRTMGMKGLTLWYLKSYLQILRLIGVLRIVDWRGKFQYSFPSSTRYSIIAM
ncbi:hypothetical protein Bca4012_063683 [Brassica carinata]